MRLLVRFAHRQWDYWTWGPFYFVRRVACYIMGHDEHEDDSTPEGCWYCRRCMKEIP